MDTEQTELYKRIQAFSLDQPATQLLFSERLASDNDWTLQYARQAMEEYKRFAFLAVAAGHPVTPSDQVDQVWHLHLTYTRSYWEEFCSQVLQTPLHHDPTLGGQAENQKFADWYSKTLESYERFFGTRPSIETWPAPKDRFGRDLQFVRINTQQNWVLSKLKVKKRAMANIAIVCTLMLSGCYIDSAENNVNIFLFAMCITAVFGLMRFLMGIADFIKNPSRPARGGCGATGWESGCGGGDSSSHSSGGCGGCGGGGCGGCGGG